MKSICSYLVDTPVFFEHYCRYMMIDSDVYRKVEFDDKDELYINEINEKYKLNIRPYMYIINSSELKHDFFLYFNKYREVFVTEANSSYVSDVTDIKDLHEVLAFVYFVQYYFL